MNIFELLPKFYVEVDSNNYVIVEAFTREDAVFETMRNHKDAVIGLVDTNPIIVSNRYLIGNYRNGNITYPGSKGLYKIYLSEKNSSKFGMILCNTIPCIDNYSINYTPSLFSIDVQNRQWYGKGFDILQYDYFVYYKENNTDKFFIIEATDDKDAISEMYSKRSYIKDFNITKEPSGNARFIHSWRSDKLRLLSNQGYNLNVSKLYAIFNVKDKNGALDITHKLFAQYSSVMAVDKEEATKKVMEHYGIEATDFEITNHCPCALKTKALYEELM